MKPIVMSSASVVSLKHKRKTITHRILKEKLYPNVVKIEYKTTIAGKHYWWGTSDAESDISQSIVCPYSVGDQLAVQELWALNGGRYVYAADNRSESGSWQPAHIMPIEACRFFLEITGLDCEMIKFISQSQAMAEGLWKSKTHGWMPGGYDEWKAAYIHQWKETNPNHKFSDTWVWRIVFKQKDHDSW